MTNEPMIEVRGVTRTYGSGSAQVHAVQDVSLSIARGELVALAGKSGSGKTTLLNLVGGLDRADHGSVEVGGQLVSELNESGLDHLRLDTVSYIFQSFGLVPMLTAAENVGLPMRLKKMDASARDSRALMLLDMVGLADHAAQRPGELSGGQQQRVAVARALANAPRILIADEPTGQLDAASGLSIISLIRAIVDSEGMTAIVATHDPTLMESADRVIRLSDGRILSS